MNGNLTSPDIVYTWVKGEDPEYRSMVADYSGKPQHLNPERYRDQFDLLRYSLRSVEKNFPSYRHLYLVTMRPQVPEWLNLKNPRLRVVHHDEFFAEKKYLPTFNHNTIESYFHLLPGIQEQFVYMNDDFFLGAPVSQEHFFQNGRPVIYGSLFGETPRFRIYDGTWLSLGFIEHCPVPVLRSAWAEMQSQAEREIRITREQKFREKHHVRMDRLYTYFMLKYRRQACALSPFYATMKKSKFIKIGNSPARELKNLRQLQKRLPLFFCLNDDQGDEPNAAVIGHYRNFLESLYPQASPYEKL